MEAFDEIDVSVLYPRHWCIPGIDAMLYKRDVYKRQDLYCLYDFFFKWVEAFIRLSVWVEAYKIHHYILMDFMLNFVWNVKQLEVLNIGLETKKCLSWKKQTI